MSNCIKFPDIQLGLSATHFDYAKLVFAKDLDGNEVKMEQGEAVFIPAYITTWRELRSFIRDHIAVAAKDVNGEIRGKIAHCREESDDFRKEFTLQLWMNASEWKDFAIG